MTETGSPLAGQADGGHSAWHAAHMWATCATRA